MGEERQHTDDLYNVHEGDRVRLETGGDQIEVTCVNRETRNADNPDLVRETNLWVFEDDNGHEFYTQIVDGLRESNDMEPFPRYMPLMKSASGEGVGMIESLHLHGQKA